MISYRYTMKASSVPIFMYLYSLFLFLCLPVICSTNNGGNHLNEQSLSLKVTQPVTHSYLTTSHIDPSNGKQSLPLPVIPYPGQSFYDVKTSENYVVVDKTKFIQKLIDNVEIPTPHKIYFFSRPRTFGKTFFLTMVHDFLQGKKGLFDGTAIASRGNYLEGNGRWRQHPVIFINFRSLTLISVQDFKYQLQNQINAIAKKYEIGKHRKFGLVVWLIQELKSKFNSRVSILIDEFDFPLTNSPKCAVEDFKTELQLFYLEIGAAAFNSDLWLVLILGVDRLQILGDTMNGMVNDITFHDEFSSMMGFSADEIEKNFKPHLDEFSKKKGWSISDTARKIEDRYGGYRFSMENKDSVLLDTGSVCSCLRNFELEDFELKTSALEDIVEEMIRQGKGVDYFKYYCINQYELKQKYSSKNRKNVPLDQQMLSKGYLTIKKYLPNKEEVCLNYPNEGIEKSIERVLPVELRSQMKSKYPEPYRLTLNELFQDALDKCDMKAFVDLLIPEAFPIVTRSLKFRVSGNYEEFVATGNIYRALNTLRLDCQEGPLLHSINDGSEVGDLDLVIFARKENMPHYAISTKFNKKPHEALFQLFKYVVTKSDEFERLFDGKPKTNIINLMGIVIKNDKDRHKTISQWIVAPYNIKDKKIWISKSEACETDIKLNLYRLLTEQPDYQQNKEKFVL